MMGGSVQSMGVVILALLLLCSCTGEVLMERLSDEEVMSRGRQAYMDGNMEAYERSLTVMEERGLQAGPSLYLSRALARLYLGNQEGARADMAVALREEDGVDVVVDAIVQWRDMEHAINGPHLPHRRETAAAAFELLGSFGTEAGHEQMNQGYVHILEGDPARAEAAFTEAKRLGLNLAELKECYRLLSELRSALGFENNWRRDASRSSFIPVPEAP